MMREGGRERVEAKLVHFRYSRSNNSAAAEGGSHENEGFLKSLWHNITNHPAHQKKPEDGATTQKDDKPKSEDGPKKKPEEDPKKNPGSGSG